MITKTQAERLRELVLEISPIVPISAEIDNYISQLTEPERIEDRNIEALGKFVQAIEKYLLANGWEKVEDVHSTRWCAPKKLIGIAGGVFLLDSAVRLQFQEDCARR